MRVGPSVRLPEVAVKSLRSHFWGPDYDWVVKSARLVRTHKGEEIRLLKLHDENTNDWAFVSLSPKTHEVTGVRGVSDENKLAHMSTTGESLGDPEEINPHYGGGEDFFVKKEYRGKGIGATLTAVAIRHAIFRRKGIAFGDIDNEKWKQVIFKMLGNKNIKSAYPTPYFVTPEDAKNIVRKGGPLRHYLPQKIKSKNTIY